jgi:hypothetical protein
MRARGRAPRPGSTTALAIPALAGPLRPGVGYTLLLSVDDDAEVYVGRWLTLAGAQRNVALRPDDDDPYADQAYIVPLSVRGDVTITTTVATPVVEQVRVTIRTGDGLDHRASACVASQVLTDDPWLGVIPGEFPTLP